jgi:hypothetical protein
MTSGRIRVKKRKKEEKYIYIYILTLIPPDVMFIYWVLCQEKHLTFAML